MSRTAKYRPKEKINENKPCRCGTGFYCHKHLRYGTDCVTVVSGVEVMSVKGKKAGAKTGARAESMGGQH